MYVLGKKVGRTLNSTHGLNRWFVWDMPEVLVVLLRNHSEEMGQSRDNWRKFDLRADG